MVSVSLRFAATLLALFLSALLSGCAAPGPDSTEARVTATKDDTFLPYVVVGGQTLQFGAAAEPRRVNLMARRDRKTGVLTVHARILISYRQALRRHYEITRNDRGEKLPMKELSAIGAGCRRPDCVHVEEFLIDLPEADVRAGQAKGYAFKVFDRTGLEVLFEIPAPLVQAIIEASDKMVTEPTKTVAAKKDG